MSVNNIPPTAADYARLTTDGEAGGHAPCFEPSESYPVPNTPERREMLIAQAIPVRYMSDREIAEEQLVILRETQKLVTAFMNDMGNGKMGQIMGVFGAMMGGKR